MYASRVKITPRPIITPMSRSQLLDVWVHSGSMIPIFGGVIIYAALSGPTGGVWRSQDTGKTWQLMLSGQATSVVLADRKSVV